MSNFGFHCGRHVLRPGSGEAVRAWALESNRCASEASETLRQEGIMLELVLYEPPRDPAEGGSLTFVIQTDDYERAVAVYLASTMPIDLYHRAFLEACSMERVPLEVLVCHRP